MVLPSLPTPFAFARQWKVTHTTVWDDAHHVIDVDRDHDRLVLTGAASIPLHRERATHWVYPLHPPVRDYQFHMTQTALFQNTIVALPTGLGKTHIAAVVMYNYYRWFPTGLIVFTAPTRPLVDQQFEACLRHTGIRKRDALVLTGQTARGDRAELWRAARVVFTTPQAFEKDVRCGAVPDDRLCLVVIDECHRAKGKAAPVGALEYLHHEGRAKGLFRILGLSATPGGSVEEIQEVVTALRAQRLEWRSYTDRDVAPFVHVKHEVTELVPPPVCVQELVRPLDTILQSLIAKLNRFGLNVPIRVEIAASYYHYVREKADEMHLVKNEVRQTIEQARLCATCREQICSYGAKTAAAYLDTYESEKQGNRFALRLLEKNEVGFRPWRDQLRRARERHDDNPKSRVLLQVLRRAFGDHHDDDDDDGAGKRELHHQLHQQTQPQQQRHHHPRDLLGSSPPRSDAPPQECHHPVRPITAEEGCIIFTTYKDSVHELVDLIRKELPHRPVAPFVGQSGVEGRKMKQADQKATLQDFRTGVIQILVATCIGEEGLDIPDVGLIICYDGAASPTRNLQRVGRTGRHRDGRVVYLLTEGAEAERWARRKAEFARLGKSLQAGEEAAGLTMASRSPVMLPHAYRAELGLLLVDATDTLGGVSPGSAGKKKGRSPLSRGGRGGRGRGEEAGRAGRGGGRGRGRKAGDDAHPRSNVAECVEAAEGVTVGEVGPGGVSEASRPAPGRVQSVAEGVGVRRAGAGVALPTCTQTKVPRVAQPAAVRWNRPEGPPPSLSLSDGDGDDDGDESPGGESQVPLGLLFAPVPGVDRDSPTTSDDDEDEGRVEDAIIKRHRETDSDVPLLLRAGPPPCGEQHQDQTGKDEDEDDDDEGDLLIRPRVLPFAVAEDHRDPEPTPPPTTTRTTTTTTTARTKETFTPPAHTTGHAHVLPRPRPLSFPHPPPHPRSPTMITTLPGTAHHVRDMDVQTPTPHHHRTFAPKPTRKKRKASAFVDTIADDDDDDDDDDEDEDDDDEMTSGDLAFLASDRTPEEGQTPWSVTPHTSTVHDSGSGLGSGHDGHHHRRRRRVAGVIPDSESPAVMAVLQGIRAVQQGGRQGGFLTPSPYGAGRGFRGRFSDGGRVTPSQYDLSDSFLVDDSAPLSIVPEDELADEETADEDTEDGSQFGPDHDGRRRRRRQREEQKREREQRHAAAAKRSRLVRVGELVAGVWAGAGAGAGEEGATEPSPGALGLLDPTQGTPEKGRVEAKPSEIVYCAQDSEDDDDDEDEAAMVAAVLAAEAEAEAAEEEAAVAAVAALVEAEAAARRREEPEEAGRRGTVSPGHKDDGVVVEEAACGHEDQEESSEDEPIASRYGLTSSAPHTSGVATPTGRPNMYPPPVRRTSPVALPSPSPSPSPLPSSPSLAKRPTTVPASPVQAPLAGPGAGSGAPLPAAPPVKRLISSHGRPGQVLACAPTPVADEVDEDDEDEDENGSMSSSQNDDSSGEYAVVGSDDSEEDDEEEQTRFGAARAGVLLGNRARLAAHCQGATGRVRARHNKSDLFERVRGDPMDNDEEEEQEEGAVRGWSQGLGMNFTGTPGTPGGFLPGGTQNLSAKGGNGNTYDHEDDDDDEDD